MLFRDIKPSRLEHGSNQTLQVREFRVPNDVDGGNHCSWPTTETGNRTRIVGHVEWRSYGLATGPRLSIEPGVFTCVGWKLNRYHLVVKGVGGGLPPSGFFGLRRAGMRTWFGDGSIFRVWNDVDGGEFLCVCSCSPITGLGQLRCFGGGLSHRAKSVWLDVGISRESIFFPRETVTVQTGGRIFVLCRAMM